jgi:WD40 repeat protein
LVTSQPLTVVLGASGTGKSSVVKAGLLPHLRGTDNEDWQILPVIRPGKSPLATLASLALPGEDNAIAEAERLTALRLDENAFAERVKTWADAQSAGSRLVFVVDQLEELITLCWDEREREHFIKLLASALNALPDRFRLILTLRSDFEPQFADCPLKSDWKASRYVVPPMTTDELREAIEGPASVRVLYFQPAELVDRLIDEVIQTPGAMPLLSFTLSELYVRYLERRGDDRCLTIEDYEQLGGVVGSLRSRARELYDQLDGPRQTDKSDGPNQATMQRIMLRMVSAQGGELARRRVPRSELVFPAPEENDRVATVLQQLSAARLVVGGREVDGDPYVEPAHDALVRSWDKLLAWTRDEQEQLLLRRLLTPAATDWETHQGGTWHGNPRLSLLNRIRRSEDSWLNQTETRFISRSVTKRFMNRVVQSSFVVVAFVALGLVTAYALNEARTSYSQQLSAQAEAELDRRPDLAILLATEACQVKPTVQARSGLLRSLLRRPHIQSIVHGHDGSVGALAFNADGSLLATAEGSRFDLAARQSTDAIIRLWDVKTGHEHDVIPTGTADAIRWLFFPFKGDTITNVSAGGAQTWDAVSKKKIAEMPPPGFPVSSAAMSPDGQFLALGTGTDETMSVLHQGTIALWNCSEVTKLWEEIGHSSRITSMVFCPRGKSLYSANGLPPEELRRPDPSIVRWDVETGKQIAEFDHESLSRSVTALAVSPDDQTLVSGCRDGTVLLWDVHSGSLRQGLGIRPRHQGAVLHISFFEAEGVLRNTKAHSFMTIGADGRVIFWANDGNAIEILEHHLEFEAAASSPDASLFATSYCVETDANDSCVKAQVGFWSRKAKPVTADIVTLDYGDLKPVTSPSKVVHTFSHDCTKLATVCKTDNGAKCIVIRDVASGGVIGSPVTVETKSIVDVAFSRNDDLLAFGTSEGNIECFTVGKSENTFRLGTMPASVSRLIFGPIADVLACGSADGDVALYDVVKQSRLLMLPRRHRGQVESLAFSPNQKVLISAGGGEIGQIPSTPFGSREGHINGEICVWDLPNRQLRFPVITAHSDSVTSLDVSPGGSVFASGGGERDRSVQLWSVDTGMPTADPLLGHSAAVTQLSFSVDGKLLISASDDFMKEASPGFWTDPKDHISVIIWDIESAEMVGVPLVGFRRSIRDGVSSYPVGFEGICDLKVRPDGKTIAAACRNGRHVFWDISLESWIDHGQRIVQRTLTSEERRRFLRNGE